MLFINNETKTVQFEPALNEKKLRKQLNKSSLFSRTKSVGEASNSVANEVRSGGWRDENALQKGNPKVSRIESRLSVAIPRSKLDNRRFKRE